jgi:hypothetical protein
MHASFDVLHAVRMSDFKVYNSKLMKFHTAMDKSSLTNTCAV